MWFEIIGLACVGVLWIESEPTQRLRSLYKKDDLFSRLINCCLCSTFWISLIVTQNIYIAAISSVLAEFICRKLNTGNLL